MKLSEALVLIQQIREKIEKLLSNEQKLKDLLFLEKDKLGIERNKLYFLGAANIAQYWWCSKYSLLKNKEMELDYFNAYLFDKIYYSYILEYIKEIPKELNKEVLRIGDELNFNDMEKILNVKNKLFEKEKEEMEKLENSLLWIKKDKNGSKKILINPKIPPYQREIIKKGIKEEYKVVNLEEEDIEFKGILYELTKSEKYPSIRWKAPWKNYLILGCPDGITDRFVYEFKHTKKERYLYNMKKIAFTQADIYCYIFKRKIKRIQIYIVENDDVKTWEEEIDKKNIEETLKSFKRIDEGGEAIPPKEWKCKVCEFREQCKT